jgi:hypothetical protein
MRLAAQASDQHEKERQRLIDDGYRHRGGNEYAVMRGLSEECFLLLEEFLLV